MGMHAMRIGSANGEAVALLSFLISFRFRHTVRVHMIS